MCITCSACAVGFSLFHPRREWLLLSPIYRRNWGSERLRNLSEITELLSGGAEIWTPVVRQQTACSWNWSRGTLPLQLLAQSSDPYPQAGRQAPGLNEQRLVNHANDPCISNEHRLGIQMSLCFPSFQFWSDTVERYLELLNENYLEL